METSGVVANYLPLLFIVQSQHATNQDPGIDTVAKTSDGDVINEWDEPIGEKEGADKHGAKTGKNS